MPKVSPMTPQEQYQCLNLLEYLSDLFGAATEPFYTPHQILILLNTIREDPEMFDPDVVVAQQIATGHIGIE